MRCVLGLVLLLLLPACDESGAPSSVRLAPETFVPEAPPTTPAAEPLPDVPEAIASWIESNAVPFEGSHLELPHDDLEFLRDVVGDARIVSLGENTHGTRDFFEMKARTLRFLVEEMDFDAFVIEATWPEARRLDRYVRTGEGDPHTFLAALYFWTWRTEAVLEMIEWMREHNETGGDVGFHGSDMQYPGMALHNVREYFGAVDPDRESEVATLLHCLNRVANDHTGRFPSTRYSDQSDAYRADCGRDLDAARDLLLGGSEEYVAASSQEDFDIAVQNFRVAVQFHLSATGEQGRDESMAENTIWIADQLGPESRLVVWAHNFHVSTQPGAQGFYLRQRYGDDMIVLGFSHETGRFTAVGQDGSNYTGLSEFDLDPVRANSFEHYASSASHERFFLDLRGRDAGDPATSWLSGAVPFRSIGCCFDPGAPDRYWYDRPLASWFDVIIHFRTTRPTTLLERRYLDDF